VGNNDPPDMKCLQHQRDFLVHAELLAIGCDRRRRGFIAWFPAYQSAIPKWAEGSLMIDVGVSSWPSMHRRPAG
jgi:hypothetical protein